VKDLLVIVPTRGRLANCQRLTESVEATRELDTDMVFVADTDDEDTYDGLTLPPWAQIHFVPRQPIGPKRNLFAVPAANEYPAVMCSDDDHEAETKGWDRLLLEPLKDGPGISYPDDKRRIDIPETPVVTSDIIKALGWICEPSMNHYYIDNVWADLANSINRLFYVPEVIHRHHHYHLDPSVKRDQTYADGEVNGPHDMAAYARWRETRMEADIATVRGLLW